MEDSKLDSLIDCAGYAEVIKGDYKTELAKYSGFTDLIERDGKIVFLEDYQKIIDKSFPKFFKFSERRLKNAKIVLISREHPSIGGVHVFPVKLSGLANDALKYAKKIISHFYPDVIVSDDNLKIICNKLDGHPLAIEFALQLLSY
jgi:hypothetical protein